MNNPILRTLLFLILNNILATNLYAQCNGNLWNHSYIDSAGYSKKYLIDESSNNIYMSVAYKNKFIYDTFITSSNGVYYNSSILKLNNVGKLIWASPIISGTHYTISYLVKSDNCVYAFGGARLAKGKTISIENKSYTIIGSERDYTIIKFHDDKKIDYIKNIQYTLDSLTYGPNLQYVSLKNGNFYFLFLACGNFNIFGKNFSLPKDSNYELIIQTDTALNILNISKEVRSTGLFPRTLTVNDDGSFYTGGEFSGDIKFFNDSFINHSWFGADDLYLSYYDKYGKFKWVKTMGYIGGESYPLCKSYKDKSCYISGNYSNRLVSGNDTIYGTSAYGTFISKYDSNGTRIWTYMYNDTSKMYNNNFDLLSNGNIVTPVSFTRYLVFGTDTIKNISTHNYYGDRGRNTCIVEFDPYGKIVDYSPMLSTGFSNGYPIVNNDTIYIFGGYGYDIDFRGYKNSDPKNSFSYMAKYCAKSVGVEDIPNSQNTLKICPNPAALAIRIELKEAENKEGVITINDLQGRALIQKLKDREQVNIDISTLSKGMYILSLRTKEGVLVGKFIKE